MQINQQFLPALPMQDLFFVSRVGQGRPPFAAGRLIILIRSETPTPQVTLQGDQSNHGVTMQSTGSPFSFAIADGMFGGCPPFRASVKKG